MWASKAKTGLLAAAGDIDQIWALYVQLFELSDREAEEVVMELDGETWREEWDSGDDLGVASFAWCSEDALNTMLNFPSGWPALFAQFRSRSCKTSWDNNAQADFTEGNADMEELSLLWHQCVGVAALVEKI